MKEYVLGFAFTPFDHVALIHKNHPEWQAGKVNGIGGKIEPNESSAEAMEREFREETGVTISKFNWKLAGMIHEGNGDSKVVVYVYTVVDELILQVKTMESEHVELTMSWNLPANMLPNVRPMIMMCHMVWHRRLSGFTLNYNEEH